jgi:hypothetical protein
MQAATESKGNEKGFRQRGAVDKDLFCARLDAYLGGAAAAHGLRGTLASVTASIERGGAGGGGEDPNLAMLRRIGWQEGRHDEFDPLRLPTRLLEQMRESERRFRLLSAKHQGTHLAHYLGTSRCHPTLLATFGDLDGGGVAGVVLERWLAKKAKERARGADGKLQAALDAVRAELAPLERAIAEARAVLDAPIALPDVGPKPERPDVELVLRGAEVKRRFAPYHAAVRAWRAPVQEAARKAQERRQRAGETILATEPLLPPLRAEQARLCAEQAASIASQTSARDEEALVEHCQELNKQGQEGRKRRDDLIRAAEADVRAAHRAWRDTAKKVAKDWLNDGSAAEPAA